MEACDSVLNNKYQVQVFTFFGPKIMLLYVCVIRNIVESIEI